MELDLSTITGDDVAQVSAEVSSQKQETTQKPRSNNFKDRENLWTSTSIPEKKIEFLKYTQTTDSFTFFYNEKTDNLPAKQLENMKAIGKLLIEKKGWTFRVGFKKSDIGTALLNCSDNKDKFEYYTITKNYNPDIYDLAISRGNNKDAFSIVKGFHKAYDKLPGFVRALCAKDVEVLLGDKLDKAVGVVFVYTPCGAESVTKDFDYQINGQVGFIIRLAKELKIPVFNIASPTFKERFVTFITNGKYVSSTAYKVSQGGNDHTDGGKVSEDLNVPKQEEPKKEEINVTEDPTSELFS